MRNFVDDEYAVQTLLSFGNRWNMWLTSGSMAARAKSSVGPDLEPD